MKENHIGFSIYKPRAIYVMVGSTFRESNRIGKQKGTYASFIERRQWQSIRVDLAIVLF